MASVTVPHVSANPEPTIIDIMPAEWQAWAQKYLSRYRQAARELPRQGEEFHRLVARMNAGPMPRYPLPKPPRPRSAGKLAEEDPDAFDRLNDAWEDYPDAQPVTEDDMAAMAHAYGQD